MVQWQAPLTLQVRPASKRLIGADLVAELWPLPDARIHRLAEFVIETFGGEIALLLGDPFLQPEMRRDDEFRHGLLLVRIRHGPAAGNIYRRRKSN